MTMITDLYLFDPNNFAQAITPYIPHYEVDRDAYVKLYSKALELIDQNSGVLYFLDQYGGWDRQSLQSEEFTEVISSENIAFWLMIFLYDNLSNNPHNN